jgi:hypothetical protein
MGENEELLEINTVILNKHGCAGASAQYPSYGNNQDAPVLMNGSRKCGTCTQWNFTQP